MNTLPEPGSAAPTVWLVGAGPGDPELLTLKAVRAIRQASVLLVDDLVGAAVLRFARRSARIVHVGKRGGCRSTPQAFTQQLMLREALAGERVVRLKGGDPFIFGRGGEEADFLRGHGLRVEVASGITAGLAAANALGVALTHRDRAHGVIIVTGHAREGSTALHWRSLAAAAAQGLTLVIYMGVSEVAALQHELLQGLPADTPVGIVQHASRANQRTAVTSLAALAATVAAERLASPSIIIVGDVLQGLSQVQERATHAGERQLPAESLSG